MTKETLQTVLKDALDGKFDEATEASKSRSNALVRPFYKKDTSVDGWPIVDKRTGCAIQKDDVIKLLNGYEAQLEKLKAAIHYPDHWDTMTYPSLLHALQEIGCSECLYVNKKED